MERMNLMYIVMRKNVFSLALLFSASLMASCNQMGSYVQTIVSKTMTIRTARSMALWWSVMYR